eukprot:TRINITY_DN107_c0_g2_i4.p1 TRINITY_DN107_c0_g2~~TRINITY_DN107_c0_g2_i4.p1  ORF type:complete len:438 (+),score=27.95 TRINITY_DN107_c0_g2_i4:31-1344(+)
MSGLNKLGDREQFYVGEIKRLEEEIKAIQAGTSELTKDVDTKIAKWKGMYDTAAEAYSRMLEGEVDEEKLSSEDRKMKFAEQMLSKAEAERDKKIASTVRSLEKEIDRLYGVVEKLGTQAMVTEQAKAAADWQRAMVMTQAQTTERLQIMPGGRSPGSKVGRRVQASSSGKSGSEAKYLQDWYKKNAVEGWVVDYTAKNSDLVLSGHVGNWIMNNDDSLKCVECGSTQTYTARFTTCSEGGTLREITGIPDFIVLDRKATRRFMPFDPSPHQLEEFNTSFVLIEDESNAKGSSAGRCQLGAYLAGYAKLCKRQRLYGVFVQRDRELIHLMKYEVGPLGGKVYEDGCVPGSELANICRLMLNDELEALASTPSRTPHCLLPRTTSPPRTNPMGGFLHSSPPLPVVPPEMPLSYSGQPGYSYGGHFQNVPYPYYAHGFH